MSREWVKDEPDEIGREWFRMRAAISLHHGTVVQDIIIPALLRVAEALAESRNVALVLEGAVRQWERALEVWAAS